MYPKIITFLCIQLNGTLNDILSFHVEFWMTFKSQNFDILTQLLQFGFKKC